jgi:hypothetical protein
MSFLEPLPPNDLEPVWATLDEDQKDEIVMALARLIANAVQPDDHGGEASDE